MKWREPLELALFHVGCRVTGRLPLPLLQRIFASIARILVRIGERRVRWALVNTRIAYPELSEAERLRLVTASCVSWSLNLLDFLRMQTWTAQDLRDHIRLEGLAALHEALSRGKGAIVLVAHLGHFELGLQALALAGIDCVVVERVFRNRSLHATLRRSRARHGAEPVDRKGAFRRLARALRKGRTVVIALDQHAGRSGRVFVPFFGLRVPTSSVAAVLALRTGAPVLPCCVVRDSADHHTGTIFPPIAPPCTGNRACDVEIATASYVDALETLIRRHPEEWMWSYRRFRGSPDCASDPYALEPT